MRKKSIDTKWAEQVMANPEEHPVFTFVETRYYLGMWYTEIPLRIHGKGGNMTMQVFRKLDEPTTWTVIYRNRYYNAGPEESAWAGKDEKNWHRATITGEEAEILTKINLLMKAMTFTHETGEPFIIRGNGEKAIQKIIDGKAPEWMQMQTQTAE